MPDLGRKSGSCCDIPVAPSEKEPEIHYPSLYISDLDEDLGLPSEGEAVIKFKVTRKSETTRKGKPTKYSYDIDVKSIYPKKGGAKKSQFKDTDDALDELKEELSS